MRTIDLTSDLKVTYRRAVVKTLTKALKLLDVVTGEPEASRWHRLREVLVELDRIKSAADRGESKVILATTHYLEVFQTAAHDEGADEGAATAFAHADRGLAALLGPEPVPQHEIGQLKAHLKELAKPKGRRVTDSGEITETRPA